MSLPKENEVYLTSDKSLSLFNTEYWIYNWKGLVWYMIDNNNALKVISGQKFNYLYRFEKEPSLTVLKSIIL
ncbi:MAG: hypothetical protein ACTSX0_12350 [Promethearchaeota archaeon]